MAMSRSVFERVRSTNMYTAAAVDEPVYWNRNESGVAFRVTGTIVKSYETIVAVITPGVIYLTPQWDCSRTTTKHVMERVRNVVSATPREIRTAICNGTSIDGVSITIIHANKWGELYV